MNHLIRLATVMLGVGMLGAAACSSCSSSNNTNSSPVTTPQTYTCSTGTHRVGNTCIGDTVGHTNTTATPLKTGN